MEAFLNRFTTLPILIDILIRKRLVLLDPDKWEDRNDAYYIERYKEEKCLKTVLALCFAARRETFHHWKVFSAGSSGVCIEFDKVKLLRHFRSIPGITLRDVKYRRIPNVQDDTPKIENWPFLKRMPYEDEKEFRIVYVSSDKKLITKAVPIDIGCIRRITLSPWMPKPVGDSVITALQALPECGRLPIKLSSVLENAKWKAAITPAEGV